MENGSSSTEKEAQQRVSTASDEGSSGKFKHRVYVYIIMVSATNISDQEVQTNPVDERSPFDARYIPPPINQVSALHYSCA